MAHLLVILLVATFALSGVSPRASSVDGAPSGGCCLLAVAPPPVPSGEASCPLCDPVEAEALAESDGCGCACPGCRCAADRGPETPPAFPIAPVGGSLDLRAHLPSAGVRTGWVMEAVPLREHASVSHALVPRASAPPRAQLSTWLT